MEFRREGAKRVYAVTRRRLFRRAGFERTILEGPTGSFRLLKKSAKMWEGCARRKCGERDGERAGLEGEVAHGGKGGESDFPETRLLMKARERNVRRPRINGDNDLGPE